MVLLLDYKRRVEGKAKQGKARQGKARQGKARQGKARQGKARQGLPLAITLHYFTINTTFFFLYKIALYMMRFLFFSLLCFAWL
jgi:hypothetical protein